MKTFHSTFLNIIGCLLLSTNIFAQDVKTINLNVTGLAYSEQQEKIYITVGGDSGEYSNSLCVVNPYLGSIEKSYFLGSNPLELAISDDSQYLYTSLRGVNKVFRFNIAAEMVDLEIPLGGDNEFLGPFYVEEIEVMPNQPTTIIVSLKNDCCSPRHEGVAIFDGAVKRPLMTPGHTGSNRIEFGSTDSLLYGYNNESTEFGFRTIAITQEGLVEKDIYFGLVEGFRTDMEYADGHIYSTNGEVIKLGGNIPERVGLLPTEGVIGAIPDTSIIYYLNDLSGELSIKTYDRSNFSELDNLVLPSIKGEVQECIVWGEGNNLAFYTSLSFSSSTSSGLVIIRNCDSSIETAPQIVGAGFVRACEGNSVTLKATGADNYIWSSGGNNDSLVISTPGDYSVAAIDANGCTGPSSNIVRVEFETAPYMPDILNGDLASFCTGGSVELESTTDISETARWSNGEIGSIIKVDEPGIYSVQTVSEIGCISAPSNTVTVQQLSDSVPPTPVIEIIGDTLLCSGETTTIVGPSGYSAYIWQDPFWLSTQRTTSNSLEINFTQTQNLVVENEAGCQSQASESLTISVNQTPFQPSILVNGNSLACNSPGETYRWYLNDVLIEGASDRFFEASTSGFYSVQVVDKGCASPISELVSVLVTSLTALEKEFPIQIYPNPLGDQLVLNSPSIEIERIVVHDVLGRELINQSIKANTAQIAVDALAKGMYLLQIFDQENRLINVEQLVKN